MSFVHKISDSEWIIKRLDGATSEITTLVKTLPGREDLCWTPDGRIVMSDGTRIYSIDPAKEKEWSDVVINSGGELLRGVTRLSINKKGTKLAIVVSE
ncbi:MAG: hypothetical protein IM589_01380 [Cytophagales bacterium]|nr:hypothetical protein [Cytophagales bacterium]